MHWSYKVHIALSTHNALHYYKQVIISKVSKHRRFCISIVHLNKMTQYDVLCVYSFLSLSMMHEFFVFMLPVAEFWVVVQVGEAATRCNLLGSYWLQVDSEELRLKDVQKNNVVQEWPYKLLRRYGADKVNYHRALVTCEFLSCLKIISG